MAVSTESVCEILVGDQADVAGYLKAAADSLRVLAVGDDSNIGTIVDRHSDLLTQVYRDDVKDIRACIRAALDGNGPEKTTSRVQLSDDEWSIVEFTIYPRGHFTTDSEPIFTGRNVTHEHFLNQRREVVNRVLRHNLRNDMEVIIGNASIAHEQCECGSQTPIAEIGTISEKLLSLGEKIREIDARLNDSNYRFRRVNLREVIERVVEEYHAAHPAVTFKLNVGDHVIAGNSLVSDAIEELVDNAIRHSETHDDDLIIEIETEEKGDEIELRIHDNGTGIPQGEATVISEATESKLDHGSGVGLWLVKWISDSVHAMFDIGPREGVHGTTAAFIFTNADKVDDSDDRQFTDLNQKKIIRTELPDAGSSDIATSTRG